MTTTRRLYLLAWLFRLVYRTPIWHFRLGPWRPGRALCMAIYTPLWYGMRDAGWIDQDGWPQRPWSNHDRA